ncbi:hypothetical protein SELMODRAFT_443772 [Selaginella moellendorffii]|uniref:Nuclease associated modular domain-containing protein n=1 Tax=Selaginella moellendorffii TaxID=88036 RepID=D8S4A7_SELML|nr:hypothetical protein SELMODRAFT_443772 [Selaginella moellendorffii]
MLKILESRRPASRVSASSWDREIPQKNSIRLFPGRRGALTVCSAQHDKSVDDQTGEGKEKSLSVRPKRVPWNKGLKMLPGPCKGRTPEEQLKVEELRRQRISAANKGRLPWNTGRKHPPETIKRIRERTLLAMRDPKIREKLRGFQQNLSDDIKAKISIGVHEHWVRKLKEIALQKQCLAEWQECIAEAARQGGDDQEELQWDSYDVERQREKEEIRQLKDGMRVTSRSQRRLEWSDEHRRKVSEAIKAKWKSEEYRTKVMKALKQRVRDTKVSSKPRREPRPPRPARPPKPPKPPKPVGIPLVGGEPRRTAAGVRVNEKFVSAVMAGEDKEAANVLKKKPPVKVNGVVHSRLESATDKAKKLSPPVPTFVDLRASEKTEKLRELRASRLLVDTKKKEAAERAKMLMAEAEAAAKALEAIAFKDQFAMASLLETRKLLAEAARSIKAVECKPEDVSILAGDKEKLELDQTSEADDQSSRKGHGSIDVSAKANEETCTDVEREMLQEIPGCVSKRAKRWHCPHDYQGWGVSRRIGWHHHHFRPPVPVPPSPLPFAPAPAPFPSPITPTPFPSPTPSPTIPTPFPSPTPSPTPTPTISPASTKTTALLSLIPFVVFVGVVALVAFGLWWVFERKRKDDGDGDREKHETRVELGFISCRNEAELQQAEDGLLREKEGDFAIDVGVQECSEAPIHHVDSIQTSSKERVGDINSCHAQESSETIQTSSEDKACEIEELGHAKEQGGGGNNRCRKSQFGRSLAAEYVDAAMACIRNDGTGTNSSFTVVRMRTALIKLTRAMEILKAESSEHEGLFEVFNLMGFAYLELENIPVAASHFERAKAIAEKNFGMGHPSILAAALSLVAVYSSMNRWSQAIRCQAEVLEHLQAQNVHPDVLKEHKAKLQRLHDEELQQ